MQARSWRKLTRSPNCPKAFMEIVGGRDKVDVMKNCSCLLRIYLRRQIGRNFILVKMFKAIYSVINAQNMNKVARCGPVLAHMGEK